MLLNEGPSKEPERRCNLEVPEFAFALAGTPPFSTFDIKIYILAPTLWAGRERIDHLFRA
eukprot:scaffold218968_cov34-Tisochrysis_lutea.AAC.4